MSDFHYVNGSVRAVSNEIFEIKRYAMLFQRLNLYIIGIALAIPFIFNFFFDEVYIRKKEDVFNYKERINAQYESLKITYNENCRLGISCAKLPDYSEYFNGQKKRYHSDFGFIYGSITVTLFPWLLILFWPVGTPVRVDRKRQLIYTRHWFCLYAARFNHLQPEFPEYSAYMERVPGPLIIRLYRAGKTHTKDGKLRKGLKLRLGLYYPQFDGQNREIYDLVEDFLNNQTDIPKDFKPKKGWLEYSLVPMRSFPNNKRLNKALDNWWDKEQYPQLCPAIEWMIHYVDELEREGKLLANPVPIAEQSIVLGGQQTRFSKVLGKFP